MLCCATLWRPPPLGGALCVLAAVDQFKISCPSSGVLQRLL